MTLRKMLVVLAIVCEAVTLSQAAIDSAGNFGAGPMLGQPMGASAKYWVAENVVVDAVAGYHFTGNLDLHMDYLWHSLPLIPVAGGRVPFYMGFGARILAGGDTQFGGRLPIGLSYLSDSQDPIELFAEIAPVLKVAPGVGLDIDGLVGVRIYVNP